MPLNTITVGTAVTPVVIETYISHYLNRKPLRQRPTAHISYHEGLCLIRQFLHYASLHTVEELQSFTSQWVPHPSWVKVDECAIPQTSIVAAAEALITQLGRKGIERVGGSKWWQWRREKSVLKAEWIEMGADYEARKAKRDEGKRVMLYVHGGAYFFGSVDEHRYQMQRHARKLKARVFARLVLLNVAGSLIDCIADDQHMLVTLRDQGLPLPAGAILISPWVDLTHSFPSVAEDSPFDYIPAHGFLQRPSAAWPPPNEDDLRELATRSVQKLGRTSVSRASAHQGTTAEAGASVQDPVLNHDSERLRSREDTDKPGYQPGLGLPPKSTIPGPGRLLSLTLDGKTIEIKDQIQMYATNQLLSHPLVSPVLQPSLGGLPPLLIMTGGGEMLRDEQIYLAHKAANPTKYPPAKAHLEDDPEAQDSVAKWKPTDVQLQVWDDLCHVAPTLSFTRPAKYMYRSIAQFGAWALARAQKTGIEIPDDDDVSVISTGSDTDADSVSRIKLNQDGGRVSTELNVHQPRSTARVGKAGDPLPPFCNHIIRQRVTRHGNTYHLEPASSIPALQLSADEIGIIKPGPVRKWLEGKRTWDTKFAKEKRKVQNRRIREMAEGFEGFGDNEVPPPSALAGRRGLKTSKLKKQRMSWGMSLWSLWGSSHDEKVIEREEKADKEAEVSNNTGLESFSATPTANKEQSQARSRSRRRTVTDAGQTTSNVDDIIDENTTVAEILQQKGEINGIQDSNYLSPSLGSYQRRAYSEGETDTMETTRSSTAQARPKSGGVAFPFKLGTKVGADGTNASTITLTSMPGVVTPKAEKPDAEVEITNNVMGGNRRRPDSLGGVNGRSGEIVMEAGEVVGGERPEPERFVTAMEVPTHPE